MLQTAYYWIGFSIGNLLGFGLGYVFARGLAEIRAPSSAPEGE